MGEMTVPVAARLMGLSRQQLTRRIRKGLTRARRVGPLYLVKPSEVTRYRRTRTKRAA